MANYKSYQPYLKQYSRKLRESMTDAEQLLWSRLRRKQLFGIQFYRQKPIGSYIVDFYAPRVKLIIEADGGQHFLNKGTTVDQARDAFFRSLNLEVIRYSNEDILKNLDAVLEDLYWVLVKLLK